MLERGSAEWVGIVDKFAQGFGSIITVLRDLEDFRVFKLTPTSGRFVMGFGKAFDFDHLRQGYQGLSRYIRQVTWSILYRNQFGLAEMNNKT